jgi:SAM-dependent methyltransferase
VADISVPLAFESGWFDVVAASLVLHYLHDWGPPLREFARILRLGGLLVLSTHHPTQDVMIATPPAPYFETVLLTRIPELMPDPKAFTDPVFYERIRNGPWFLFIRAVVHPDRCDPPACRAVPVCASRS